MKQHNLLFRYLDGEISREEDQILREQLTQDKELNEDFQTFLEIDYNINKLNDEIEFPDDFLNEIGNNIQTKLAVDQQVRIIRKELNARYTKRFVIVPALIALFISIFVSNIENPFFNLNRIFSANQNEINEPEVKTINNQTNSKKVSSKSNISKAKTFANNQILQNDALQIVDDVNLTVDQSNLDNNLFESSVNSDKIITNSRAISSDVSIKDDSNQEFFETISKSIPIISLNSTGESATLSDNQDFDKQSSNGTNSYNSYSKSSSINNNYESSSNYSNRNSSVNYLPFDHSINFSGNFTNIELKTIVGTDFFNFGVDKNSMFVNSFTQSFASKIDDFNKVGLETGYSEFNSKVMKYIEIKNSKTNSSKLLSQEDSDENPLLTRIENVQSQFERMFLVGVFYELDYLKGENYALSSRLTLGATDVGAYSSLKFMFNYKLFKNVNVTIGSDARIFNGNFNASTQNEINSTLSLIYGLNFAF
jgi:hypothetical protein